MSRRFDMEMGFAKKGLRNGLSKIKFSQFLKVMILISLYFYTGALVYDGPIYNWARNITVIRKNSLKLKGTYYLRIR